MFRDCYFEFAGKSSEIFNLMLYYIKNDRDYFSSGGDFEMSTDTIPYSYEQLLYGKDYSKKPLEFEVEIVTPEGNIPVKQMAEIKEWLFGQDGWRDLTISDDTQSYHLKCILVPLEDITDCIGYRGVRCKICNASPFWYGDEKTITLTSELTAHPKWDSGHTWDRWCTFEFEIPNNGYVDMDIYPVIEVCPRRNTNRSNSDVYPKGTYFALSNTPATSYAAGAAYSNHEYDVEENSRVSLDFKYMADNGTVAYSYTEDNGTYSVSIYENVLCTVVEDNGEYKISVNNVYKGSLDTSIYSSLSNDFCKPVVAALNLMGYRATDGSTAVYAKDKLEINTQYGVVNSEIYPNAFIPLTVNTDLPKPMFKLHYGKNVCRIYYGHIYESITLKYTPMFRMGAF